MGKTSFVLNIAQNVANWHETPQPSGRLLLAGNVERAVVHATAHVRGAHRAHRLRVGIPVDRRLRQAGARDRRLEQAKIFIDDTASIGVLEMRAKARRLQAEHGLHLLIIDYIQLMQGRGRFDNRQQELASISRSLKGLAKELRCPIVAQSQLSRAAETARIIARSCRTCANRARSSRTPTW